MQPALMQATSATIAAPRPVAAASRLRECPDCGLFQSLPALPPRAAATCLRCHAVLRRNRADPILRPLVLALTGLMLLVIATQSDFVDLRINGVGRATSILTGPSALEAQGMGELGLVVLVTTVLAPLLRLLAIGWVTLGLRLGQAPAYNATVFRWAERLRPWSMVEVFLLGLFVAYTKLVDLAQVQVGAAVYAMGALMLVMAATDATLDPDAVWEALDRREPASGRARPAPLPARGPLAGMRLGCDVCGEVSVGLATCPRCGAALRHRKPDSLTRTWALMLAAACFYIPANLLPVLTLVKLGRGAPSTILGGVRELAAAGMWPLAALVFVASITVPLLKFIGLTIMLATTRRRTAWRLRERTTLYRVVDFIGRWSMIDVFMISILTALVRMGTLASVYPGPGVLAFCAVVILTMLAAISFDPRLMWDAAEARTPPHAGGGR